MRRRAWAILLAVLAGLPTALAAHATGRLLASDETSATDATATLSLLALDATQATALTRLELAAPELHVRAFERHDVQPGGGLLPTVAVPDQTERDWTLHNVRLWLDRTTP